MTVGEEIAARFAWVDGHADVWRLFSDPMLFGRIAAALADPFRESGITLVCGIESRGFILGGAVARELDVGFAAIRKEAGLYPGPKIQLRTETDYRGTRQMLRLQRRAVSGGDRVLVVDDWAERGSQARAKPDAAAVRKALAEARAKLRETEDELRAAQAEERQAHKRWQQAQGDAEEAAERVEKVRGELDALRSAT